MTLARWTRAGYCAIALALFGLATPAQAEDINWNSSLPSGTYSWFTPGNWTENSVPVDGQSVSTEVGNVSWTFDIENGGLGVNLPNSDLRFGRGSIIDSSAGGDPLLADDGIVANTVAFNGAGGASMIVDVPVTANLYTSNRHGAVFNALTNIPEYQITGPHQDHTTFNVSPANIITLINHAGSGSNDLNINADVTVDTYRQDAASYTGRAATHILRVGPGATFTINTNWDYVRGNIENNGTIIAPAGTGPSLLQQGNWWVAGADGSIPSNPITIEANSRIQIDAVQTGTWDSSNRMTIMPGGILAGDMTNAIFSAAAGAAQNVTIHADAIYVPSAGDTLTQADIVGGTSVWGGALNLRPTSSAYTVQGDDTTGAIRGIAIGPFTTFWNNGRIQGTLTTADATGDMSVLMLQDAIVQGTSGEWFKMLGNATSTTANIISSGGRIHWEGLNQKAIADGDPNPITTFNFSNASDNEGNEILRIERWRSDAIVDSTHTINVEGGKAFVNVANNLGTNMAGALSIGDGGGLQLAGSDNFNNPTATIEFKSGSALRIESNYQVFEDLDPSQIVVESDPAVTPIVLYNNRQDLPDRATAPNYYSKIVDNFNIAHTGDYTRAYVGAGLIVGDGKYVMGVGDKNQGIGGPDRSTGETTTYFGIEPGSGATSMGIAAHNGRQLTINVPTQAPGATLMIGNDKPMVGLSNYNGNFNRSTGPWDGTVRFEDTITAAGIAVKAGTMQTTLSQTVGDLNIGAGAVLDLEGGAEPVVTVTNRLSGAGRWEDGGGIVLAGGGTLAPGDGIGTLTGDANLVLGDGTSYEWEIADPDGGIGTGWDMFQSDSLVDLSGASSMTFNIVDDGITREITTDEQFVVASAANFNIPGNLALNFTVVPDVATWNISGAQLLPDVRDIGNGPEPVLYLTGVSATFGAAEVVPEPSTLVLAALGLLGLGIVGWRRRRTG